MWEWYKLFNLTEWLSAGLVSRTLTRTLEGRGEKDILICQGNETSIKVDDIFLPLNFNGENPWREDGTGVFVDSNQDVWLGYEVEEA